MIALHSRSNFAEISSHGRLGSRVILPIKCLWGRPCALSYPSTRPLSPEKIIGLMYAHEYRHSLPVSTSISAYSLIRPPPIDSGRYVTFGSCTINPCNSLLRPVFLDFATAIMVMPHSDVKPKSLWCALGRSGVLIRLKTRPEAAFRAASLLYNLKS